MSQEDDSSKSHEPTQKKLDDARKKGEIPKSSDLSVAAAYGGFLLCALAAGSGSIQTLGDAFVSLIDRPERLAPLVFDGDPRSLLGGLALSVGRGMLPWLVLPGLAVILMTIAQRGFVFAPDKLRPKLSRISPISNAKNKYGRNGLFEFAKSFVKLVIYSVCLGVFLKVNLPDMANSMMAGPSIAVWVLTDVAIQFLFVATVIAVSIGGVDYLWQHAEHMRKNRMSDKEIRDEHKEAEGDPYMKQQRRQRGQEIALNQMMGDVPEADVVIVNPTHYAVALKWSRKRGEAPRCVAKGVDEIARAIRETAQDAGVPIHSDPPTARALHATTNIGDEIQPEHYRAVAAAIRFAEAMRKRASWGV
ncbi:MAG: flagellar biosynthesis protein FlhB [Rhodobacterales bacterium]|nr:MAG: flagellar biosynthesis protein FlhB [Rhodobacterales bacterium]